MSLSEFCTSAGVNIARLQQKTRKREIVTERKQVCFHLWQKGYCQEEIAAVLNITQPAVSFHISHPYTLRNDF